jgi:sugar/nucleoside kinase (ribokinase family)
MSSAQMAPTTQRTRRGRRSPRPPISISAPPSSWAARRRRRSLSFAREHGVATSADLLAPGEQAQAIAEWIAPALAHLDYLLPNDDQVLGLTGTNDLLAGCRELLARGVGCVAATCGAAGALIVGPSGAQRVPAFAVEIVDTTGCGDAFSAGFLRGLALNRGLGDAAMLG